MPDHSPSKESTWRAIQDSIQKHPVARLRLELVFNELIRQDIVSAKTLFVSPDPSSLSFFKADVDLQDYVEDLQLMRTGRASFYDRLPEQLFHKPVSQTSEDNYQQIRRGEEKQEGEARKFFLPFDNRLYHLQAAIEQFEQTALAGDNQTLLQELIRVFWSSEFPIEGLIGQQLVSLLQLVTEAHHLAGDLPVCQTYLNKIIGQPVQLTMDKVPISESTLLDDSCKLGTMQLGCTSALTGERSETLFPVISVQIGPVPADQLHHYVPGGFQPEWPFCVGNRVPADQLHHYVPGGRHYLLIEGLCELIFPLESDYIVHSFTDSVESEWLGHPVSFLGRLGYTTFIPSKTL